jgi:hypothetical protein
VAETEKERVDRELIEFLNELRVALPGVQVLFAFLLIVPFSTQWTKVTVVQRDVYFAAFLSAAAACALLIAPSAYHRMRWRDPHKEEMLVLANRLAICGLAFLVLGMSCTVFVITDVLYETAAAVAVSVAAALLFGCLWFVLPLVYSRSD